MSTNWARYLLLAAIMAVFAVALVSEPGKPSIAYRALRRVGLISVAAASPVVPGQRLQLAQKAFSAIGNEPPQPVRAPGHPMLIDIFATWCPPCRDELAALSLAAPKLRRDGVELAGIDREESAAQVSATLHAFGLNYPVYIDEGYYPSWASMQRVIPTTILIDRKGVVRFVHEGPLDAPQLLALARSV